MLIEFSVGNFASFKERITLSMVAAKIKARDPRVNENNIIKVDDNLNLLVSAGIYGANASGKRYGVLRTAARGPAAEHFRPGIAQGSNERDLFHRLRNGEGVVIIF